MNIGIFTDTFLPQVNGVVVSICNVNRCLVKRKHNLSVFTVGDGPVKMDGYSIYRFKGKTFKPYPEYKILMPNYRMWGTIRKKNIDVIHSRSPFGMGMIAKRLARSKKIPIVGTFDTPITDYLHYVPLLGSFKSTKYILEAITKKYLRKYYSWCDLVTAPSETTKNKLLSLGFKNNIEVVSNGVDVEKYNPRNRDEKLKKNLCPNGEKLILHVGRITKEKNVSQLIEIASILKKNKTKFKMLIAGDGPELKKIKISAENLGLKDNIIFTGYLSQKELPKYYASSDLFLTASTVETQGIVLLESLASGLPVIGANVEAIPELIKNRKNGFLFNPEKPEEVASLIENVLNDESLKKKLSKNCPDSVKSHSIPNVCLKMENIYKSLL